MVVRPVKTPPAKQGYHKRDSRAEFPLLVMFTLFLCSSHRV